MKQQINNQEITKINEIIKQNYTAALKKLKKSNDINYKLEPDKYYIGEKINNINNTNNNIIAKDISSINNNKLKKNISFNLFDIKIIIFKITFSLQLKNITKESIIQRLTNNLNNEEYINYDTLYNILSSTLFNLQDKNDINILCKYLIEEDNQKIIILKSILNNLFINYCNIDYEYHFEKIKQKLLEKRKIFEQLAYSIPDKMNIIDIYTFIVTKLNIDINDKELETILFMLYLETLSYDSLSFKNLYNNIDNRNYHNNYVNYDYNNIVLKIYKNIFNLSKLDNNYRKELYNNNEYNKIPMDNSSLLNLLSILIKDNNVYLSQENYTPNNKFLNIMINKSFLKDKIYIITINNYNTYIENYIENKKEELLTIEINNLKEQKKKNKNKKPIDIEKLRSNIMVNFSEEEIIKLTIKKLTLITVNISKIYILKTENINNIKSYYFIIDTKKECFENVKSYNLLDSQININIKYPNYIVNLNKSMIDKPDISLLYETKELFVKKNGWYYCKPNGFIKYNISNLYFDISYNVYAKWIPCYMPLFGIDLSKYKNELLMSYEVGPNKDNNKSFNPNILKKGFFLTPNVNILLKNNSNNEYYIYPHKLKDINNNYFYFYICLECYINPTEIIVPSIFSYNNKDIYDNLLIKKYKEYFLSEFYFISNPSNIILTSILIKNITEDEYNKIYLNNNDPSRRSSNSSIESAISSISNNSIKQKIFTDFEKINKKVN